MAAAIIGLGALGLIHGDFVRKWEPAPAGLPLHELAWASALVLLACGAGLLAPRVAAASAIALALFLLSWIAVLHAPVVATHPGALAVWTYPAGVLAVSMGAMTLWSMSPPHEPGGELLRIRVRTAARLLFAVALIVFGLPHLFYAHGMAALVPAVLPLRTEIVYATGLAHIAAGLALLSNVLARPAATLEAAMLSGFVLLVDLPRLVEGLAPRPPWAICFETAIAGAAWVVAGSLSDRRAGENGQGSALDPAPTPERVGTSLAGDQTSAP